MDEGLGELKRRVLPSPESGRDRVNLALALARSGVRREAVEAYYKARVLGAEADEVRRGLRALGVPASPGYCIRAGTPSPCRGPRRGVVVARATLPVQTQITLDEDGALFGVRDCELLSFELRTLEHLGTVSLPNGARSVIRAPRGLILAGPDFHVRDDGGAVRSLALEQESPMAEGPISPYSGASSRETYRTPIVDAEGRTIVTTTFGRVQVLDRDLRRIAEFRAGPRISRCIASPRALWFIVREPHPGEPDGYVGRASVRAFDLDARCLVDVQLERPGRLQDVDAFLSVDDLGAAHVLTVSPSSQSAHLRVFADDGRLRADLALPLASPVRAFVARDEECWIDSDSTLARLERGEAVWTSAALPLERWRRDMCPRRSIVDREGAAYMGADRGIVAIDPSGATLFEVAEPAFVPLVIDPWARVLAMKIGALTRELVAIE